MKRDILDDLPLDERSDTEPYEPGIEVDPALIKNIVNYKVLEITDMQQFLSEVIPPELDSQCLLDALVMRLSEDKEKSSLDRRGFVLDSVVQYFYDRGDNDFLIDISSLKVCEPYTQNLVLGAYWLEGTYERPLECSYVGSVYKFGAGAKHCIFRLSGHSPHPGWWADRCDYYLDTVNPGLMVATCYDDLDIDKGPLNCRFFLKDGIDNLDALFQKVYLNQLLERGNSFHELGEDGKWKVIKP